MPRIIKFHSVNVAEDALKISVPNRETFISNIVAEDENLEEIADPEEILRNAEHHAGEIISEAKKSAEIIINEAKAEAGRQREAIYEDARQSGYDKGYNEARIEGKSIIAEAESTLAEAQEERGRLLRGAEPEIVSLIIDIIEKLLGDLVKLNPGVIAHIVRTGLEGAPNAKELAIRVSDGDFGTLTEMKQEILSYVDSDMELTFIKDTQLSPGECIIDTPIGSVESSISRQWNGIKSDLIQILKAENH